ncbi:MAG: aminodeoxychorismate/anthranilate synthase component II [Armatimonadetes bacterium]|nr:aminodeoxychorismate/anthranilate synthase component II [Armatimonadota bacterium]MDE2205602.1 aminodeoxychorismate/anthranilate synthase component II [Armatimonadota bacterium]
MILLIDNYDSFTYNLAQYLGELGSPPRVIRNDRITLDEVAELAPDRVVLSPGPCTPNEAGICVPLLQRFANTFPILGVCLGHQAIGQAFGGRVIRNERVMHGKTSKICHFDTGVFAGLPNPFVATRYHSLVVERATLPSCLEVTAETEAGEIMGIRHTRFAVEGVQFHPESVLTTCGKQLMANFLGVTAPPTAQPSR